MEHEHKWAVYHAHIYLGTHEVYLICVDCGAFKHYIKGVNQ